MKIITKDALFGLLIIIVITILEFIVTIPFGEPAQEFTSEVWAKFINRELLLTALPAALTNNLFSQVVLKTKSKDRCYKKRDYMEYHTGSELYDHWYWKQ